MLATPTTGLLSSRLLRSWMPRAPQFPVIGSSRALSTNSDSQSAYQTFIYHCCITFSSGAMISSVVMSDFQNQSGGAQGVVPEGSAPVQIGRPRSTSVCSVLDLRIFQISV